MSPKASPEERAREIIDEHLSQAGWVVQDPKDIDLVNNYGVAVRERNLSKEAGRVDYLLYINRKIVGVIEAKPSGNTLSEVSWQSRRYSKGLTDSQKLIAVLQRDELPFIYEATGTESTLQIYMTPNHAPGASSTFKNLKLLPALSARVKIRKTQHGAGRCRLFPLRIPMTLDLHLVEQYTQSRIH